MHWIKCKDEPVNAFLTGVAGVGKSVVIRALYQSIYRILNLREGENPDDIKILHCAYMGFDAFNISCVIIYSAFHKKIYQGTDILSSDELNTYRIKYRHLKVNYISCNINSRQPDIKLYKYTLTATDWNKSSFWWFKCDCCWGFVPAKASRGIFIVLDLEMGASSIAQNLWKEHFKMYEYHETKR